jgi:hypothetical protein
MVDLLIVPAAADALKAGDFSGLQVDQGLRRMVEDYLDRYRLLTTTLRIGEPHYVGIQVCAQLVRSEYSQPEVVRTKVIEKLRNYLSPLALDQSPVLVEGDGEVAGWEGWPFGHDLYVAELYSLIQRVPGVKHVLDVSINQRPLVPSRERPDKANDETPLTPLTEKKLEVPDDTLLCSLEHQIELVEL